MQCGDLKAVMWVRLILLKRDPIRCLLEETRPEQSVIPVTATAATPKMPVPGVDQSGDSLPRAAKKAVEAANG